MKYVVCEDLDDATDTKVHDATCRVYVGRKRDAPTMKWHGPLDTKQAADELAKAIATRKRYGARDARCCLG